MDEGSAGIGIGGCFRRCHALDGAMAEFLGMARDLLLQNVREHRGDGAAEARCRPAEESDAGPAEDGGPGAPPFGPGEPELALDADDVERSGHGAFHHSADLGNGKQADHDDEEVDPVLQLHDPQGEAWHAALQIDAHGRQPQADEGGHQALGQRIAGERADGRKRKEDQAEILGRPEMEGQGRERHRHKSQRRDAHRAGDKGADGRDRKGRGCSPFSRQGIAIQHRHHRGGITRRIEQDRGHRAPASIIRAVVGSMPKVTGISSAMPADGPMPGRWLIIVPMNVPIRV